MALEVQRLAVFVEHAAQIARNSFRNLGIDVDRDPDATIPDRRRVPTDLRWLGRHVRKGYLSLVNPFSGQDICRIVTEGHDVERPAFFFRSLVEPSRSTRNRDCSVSLAVFCADPATGAELAGSSVLW